MKSLTQIIAELSPERRAKIEGRARQLLANPRLGDFLPLLGEALQNLANEFEKEAKLQRAAIDKTGKENQES